MSRRTWPGKSAEPFSWMVFGAGGMVGAIAMPVLVAAFGLLVPIVVLAGGPDGFDRVRGLLTNPVVVVLALAALGSVLWHAAHRLYHTLHDVKVHVPGWVHAGLYALAVAVPLGGAAVIFAM